MGRTVPKEIHGPHKKLLDKGSELQFVEIDSSTFVLLAHDGSVHCILSETDLLSIPQLQSDIRMRLADRACGDGLAKDPTQQTAARYASLTPRERQVMKLLVAAKQTKQIARQLGIAPKTAEHHRSRILEKMQVTSTGELIRLMLRGEL